MAASMSAGDYSMISHDSLNTRRTLTVNGVDYDYFSIPALAPELARLPFSLKILLENLLRHEDGENVTTTDIQAISQWLTDKTSNREIAYRPARVLMQDYTGVPAIADLASMRDALAKLGGNPEKINPLTPVDLVIDHSVQVDQFGDNTALKINAQIEMQRNGERYEFLRWGQNAFENFRVVPPDIGICHQINLEYLAKTVWVKQVDNKNIAYPDTLVGTDSHTTMINGLGVLGWGVGGIEAEAAMLGQPISMLIPEVVGMKLTGKLTEGVTATDLVLTITNLLRKKGVVGKFVEFYGAGLCDLPLADRATISNMAPEYGATCGFFPIDEITLNYLRLTGRDAQTIALAESYAKAQGMWHDLNALDPVFTDTLTLDLATVEPSLAGPKRPQDRVALANVAGTFNQMLTDAKREQETFPTTANFNLHHGDVVIAAITSCTNTSNPSVLMAAGLVAKKALEKGLQKKPWVKTSLAPGSQVVTRYLEEADLQKSLDALGFNLVGYGCTTCIGNSGPLPEPVATAVAKNDLIVAAVLSGNRNFEGRVHPQVKANWLASPPLVVAYALAGTTQINLNKDSLGDDKSGQPVYLKDIWPTNLEVANEVAKVTSKMFSEQYANVFVGTAEWQAMEISANQTYTWKSNSTYIQNPPFFDGMQAQPAKISDIKGARILALLGDSITTDHISPAGSIKADSPAGKYLIAEGVGAKDFNSYGARRGNHEVMMRGTFANIRIKNEMVAGVEGGFTKFIPTGAILSIYDAAMEYQKTHTPLVIIAGKEYGTGSSRDWAAKGPKLLGVNAVIAESFERIHRSNLIGMGILPLEFKDGMTRKTLGLTGDETINIVGLEGEIKSGMNIKAIIDSKKEIELLCRIDTSNEAEYYRHGGILQFVLRSMLIKS
jgi:aconitate hydratase